LEFKAQPSQDTVAPKDRKNDANFNTREVAESFKYSDEEENGENFV